MHRAKAVVEVVASEHMTAPTVTENSEANFIQMMAVGVCMYINTPQSLFPIQSLEYKDLFSQRVIEYVYNRGFI